LRSERLHESIDPRAQQQELCRIGRRTDSSFRRCAPEPNGSNLANTGRYQPALEAVDAIDTRAALDCWRGFKWTSR
jgi:hypothetical protein